MIKMIKPIIGREEINSVTHVLKSGQLAQGPKVEELERNFKKLCKTKFAIATNNGTSALHTALHSLGIVSGDEVITSPFTFVATANSILMTGAKPVFVDIEEDTFNINPSLIEKKINKKTRAILAVNLFGQPANYKEINRIAKKHNLFVIEDAAQSIGATYYSNASGNLADIACFSMYATKNVISGEGGMITTNNKKWEDKARRFRQHGQIENKRYHYSELGFNYRMTDIQAAIALEQLKRITTITKRKQEIAKIYNEALGKIKGIQIPEVSKNLTSVFHQYTIRVTKEFKISRDSLKLKLKAKDVQTIIYYPVPLYKVDHLRFNHRVGNFPVTEIISKQVLSLPIHPQLTNKDIKYIIGAIKAYER